MINNKFYWIDCKDETTIQYYSKINWNITYSINFNQEKNNENYLANNIQYIIFENVIPETSYCICGFGDNVDTIFQFKNGHFGYLCYHSSCLSESVTDSGYDIEIAEDLNDLIEFCLSSETRETFYK